MASTIFERIISSITDKRMMLSSSTPVRAPEMLAGAWTKARIALRYSIRDSGVNISGTPRFAVGLCHGSANSFGKENTDLFVGVVTNNTTLTRNAGSPPYYSGANLAAATRIGSTLALNASGINSGGSHILADPANGYRSLFFVDITKGTNPTPDLWSINAIYRNATTGSDISEDEFLLYAQQETFTLANHTTGTARTRTVDEGTYGTLDYVNIAWNQSAPQIEVSDVAIVKFA